MPLALGSQIAQRLIDLTNSKDLEWTHRSNGSYTSTLENLNFLIDAGGNLSVEDTEEKIVTGYGVFPALRTAIAETLTSIQDQVSVQREAKVMGVLGRAGKPETPVITPPVPGTPVVTPPVVPVVPGTPGPPVTPNPPGPPQTPPTTPVVPNPTP